MGFLEVFNLKLILIKYLYNLSKKKKINKYKIKIKRLLIKQIIGKKIWKI